MTTRLCVALMVLAVAVLLAAPCTASAADPDPAKLLSDATASSRQVTDFTAVLTREEQATKSSRKTEVVHVKYRREPYSVYIHWLKDPNKGREVIYVQGQNDGQILSHQPFGLLNLHKEVNPSSSDDLVRDITPVTQAMFPKLMDIVSERTGAGAKRNEVLLRYLGTEGVDGRTAHIILRVFTTKRDDYPVQTSFLYIDTEWKVPLKFVAYDWDYRLLGVYTFTDVKLDLGLTEKDFDPTNPKYNFPRERTRRKLTLPWPFGNKDTD